MTMPRSIDPNARSSPAPMRFGVVLGALLAVLVLAGCSDDDSGDAAGSDPAAVLDAYVAAYNRGDVDAVMAFYSDASVVLGFPFADEQRGLESIRSVMIQDIAAAAASDALTISNVAVSGNEVTWDQVWVDDGGEEFCVEGQTAVIEGGKILLFTWPPGPPTQCG